MGDEAVPVGPATGGETKVEIVTPEQPTTPPPSVVRAAKIAAAREGMRKLAAAPGASAPTSPTEVAAKPEEKPPAPAKPDEDAPPDAQAAKAIEAIEKRDKRAREQLAAEKAAHKAEIELERAELARMRAEMTGKPNPLDDLKKLPTVKRAIEAIKLAGLNPDDEEVMEVIARDAYARSRSGKADPKNKAYADQVAEKQGLQSELAELRKMVEETRESLTQRDQRAQLEQFQTRYLDEAVKAIPADPSFIGLHHSANPAKARAALLQLGQHMENESGETPTHAEVIARYEEMAKADLLDRGFTEAQVASMLAKPQAAKPAPSPMARTLDPSTGPTTAPINGHATREQRIAAARAGRIKLNTAP